MNRDRACRWLIGAASRLVPASRRDEWLREWDGELWWWRRSHAEPQWDAEMLRRAWGAFPDAYWHSDVRAMTRGPVFCLAAAAALLAVVALASGGFAVTRSRIAPLEYADAGRVVTISQRVLTFSRPMGATQAQIAAWRRHFDGLAFYRWEQDSTRSRISADFFGVLGVAALHGRTIAEGDADAAVLSYDYWHKRFGADPAIVGRDAAIDGRKLKVIGVLPETFWFLSKETEVWTLLASEPGRFGVVARLAQGVTPERVAGELLELGQPRKFNRDASLHSMIDGWTHTSIEVTPVQSRIRQPLQMSGLGVLLALAIAAGAAFRWRREPRYALFFLGKTWLILPPVGLAALEFTRAASNTVLGGSASLAEPFSAWFTLTGSACVLYWAFVDQRKRCRLCLNQLTRGVRVGRPAAILFDYSGEELVCGCGHGALYIPELQGQLSDRWAPLDESWRGLFGSGSGR